MAHFSLWLRPSVRLLDSVPSLFRTMKTSSLSFFATIVLLLTTLVIFKASERTHAEYLAQPLDTVSHEINGWVLGAKETLAPEELRVIVPTDYISRLYRRK